MRVDERFFSNLISPFDVRDYKLAITSEKLPDTFQLQEVTVKNQGSTGSCVAHACSSIVEYFNSKQENNDTVFSTEFIYGYRPEGYYVGEGMYIREALKTLQKVGVCPLDMLKGNNNCLEAMKNVSEKLDDLVDHAYPHRISTYLKVKTVREIKEALYKHGYVIISMPWHKDYKLKDGVYTYSSDETRGNHAVVIYGWNEKGWLIQNSWGKGWGQKGKFILPFDFALNEAWAVTDTIIDGKEIIKPANNLIIKLFSSIINFFANLLRKR